MQYPSRLAAVPKPVMTPGGTHAIDTLYVQHKHNGAVDGISSVSFKSFEQKSEKLMSESLQAVWIDERCSEEIYSELLARTIATTGIVFLSYTPLKGGGELTYRFLNEYSPDRSDIRIEADEARHIPPEERARIEASLLPHERDARIHGIPQLGIARVFPFPLETLMRDFNPDNDIRQWARWIVGIDFGYGHPFAAALCAWVHDLDEFYVVDGFKMERSEALYHTKRIAAMCRGMRIPIAWPHDGYTHERGSGLALREVYARCGAPMLQEHAQNHGTEAFHVEPAIEEMIGYMRRGVFTIASHMTELGEEILSYHRDEDYRIVRLRDDLLSAVRYAFMMRRQGKQLVAVDSYGRAPGMPSPDIYDPRARLGPAPGPTMARGIAGQDWDIFTGRAFRE